jgi:hypothetical protein
MHELLATLKVADGWLAYYEAYKALYREVLERRWALGRATFANQLHHTAVPDASGATIGAVGWAAYSQPSDASLSAFLAVFTRLVSSEPHRIRSNRYLFLVPNDPALDRHAASTALGPMGDKLDYWCGSLEEALAWPQKTSSLESINAMLRVDVSFVQRSDAENLLTSSDKKNALNNLRAKMLETPVSSNSTLPPAIRNAYLDSSVVLAAIQIGLSPSDIVAICGEDVGVAAFIACDRASASGWQNADVSLCKDVLALAPPATRVYTVAPGDILTRVVRHFYEQPFETLWPLISILNPEINDPNLIRIGQRLRLPLLGNQPAGLAEPK